jgi:hypothetical protein
MDRLRVEAFGGEEFQRVAGAAQIDRTDFGHHVCGDHHDELVEAHLRARRLRHDFAQAAQQYAGSACCRGHSILLRRHLRHV